MCLDCERELRDPGASNVLLWGNGVTFFLKHAAVSPGVFWELKQAFLPIKAKYMGLPELSIKITNAGKLVI